MVRLQIILQIPEIASAAVKKEGQKGNVDEHTISPGRPVWEDAESKEVCPLASATWRSLVT